MEICPIVVLMELSHFFSKTENPCFILINSRSNLKRRNSRKKSNENIRKKIINRLHWTIIFEIAPIGTHVSIGETICHHHTSRYSMPQEVFHLAVSLYFYTWLCMLVIFGSRTYSWFCWFC